MSRSGSRWQVAWLSWRAGTGAAVSQRLFIRSINCDSSPSPHPLPPRHHTCCPPQQHPAGWATGPRCRDGHRQHRCAGLHAAPEAKSLRELWAVPTHPRDGELSHGEPPDPNSSWVGGPQLNMDKQELSRNWSWGAALFPNPSSARLAVAQPCGTQPPAGTRLWPLALHTCPTACW